MKVCAISDLHGILPKIINKTDVLFICGDIVPLYIQNDISKSKKWLKTIFSSWINSLPCDKVFAVWGNHEIINY